LFYLDQRILLQALFVTEKIFATVYVSHAGSRSLCR